MYNEAEAAKRVTNYSVTDIVEKSNVNEVEKSKRVMPSKEDTEKLKVVARDLEHDFKLKNRPSQYPLFAQMETVVKSLEEGKFEVKSDDRGHTVHFKRVIVVGPLPDKTLAENITEEYNNITEKHRKKIKSALADAEKKVNQVFEGLVNNVKQNSYVCDV